MTERRQQAIERISNILFLILAGVTVLTLMVKGTITSNICFIPLAYYFIVHRLIVCNLVDISKDLKIIKKK